MSDPAQKSDLHGDIEAVRRANLQDPHRKIYDGPRPVTPAVA